MTGGPRHESGLRLVLEPIGQPVPIENERSQRTLMDLIFGGEQN